MELNRNIKVLALLLAVALLSTATIAPFGMAFANNDKQKYVPGELLIKFNEDSKSIKEQILKKHGAKIVDSIEQIDVQVIKVPSQALGSVESALRNNKAVKYVEKNFLLEPAVVPNDPYYYRQWHLSKIGAPSGWDIGKGSANTSVAILDTGVDPSHPDLKDKLLNGYNFYDNNSNWSDVCGHGTGVAGTAAAVTNNGIGVAGVAWENKILPIRITDTNCYGYYSTMAKGIVFAADNGARVANISFRIFNGDTLTDAAKYMYNKGGWVVAAGGNTGTYENYKDNPYIISVSATDSTDNITSFSSYGPYIDFAAPGSSIYTTSNGGSYGYKSGTSFSSPVTAGLIALMFSQSPGMTSNDVYDILKRSAVDRGTAGYDNYYGWGRIDAYNALKLASSYNLLQNNHDVSVTNASVQESAIQGDAVTINVSVVNEGAVSETFDVKVTDLTDSVSIGMRSVTLTSGSSSTVSFTWNTEGATLGTHTLQAEAIAVAGETDFSDNVKKASINISQASDLPKAVSVNSISYYKEGGRQNSLHLKIVASLIDDMGNAVPSAVVTIDVYVNNVLYTTASGTSGTDGKVAFKLNRAPAGCYNTIVTNVKSSGLTWDGNTPANGICK
ncbi:MAG: S8 family serine peptidase [Nitrososphaerales archaeon]